MQMPSNGLILVSTNLYDFKLKCVIKTSFFLFLSSDYKSTCYHQNQDSVSSADLVVARTNQEIYNLLFNKFIPCVMGKQKFQQQLRLADGTQEQEFCTISDEAFAILVIENLEERWDDILEKNDYKVYPNRGKKEREWMSDVPPKYTMGGIKYKNKNNNNPGRGWGEAGINRYNELCATILDSRNNNPDCFVTWLQGRQEQLKNTKKTPKRKIEKIYATHNLFSDTESDDENDNKVETKNNEKEQIGVDDSSDDDNDDDDQSDGDDTILNVGKKYAV